MQIRRSYLDAAVQQGKQVVGDDAFNRVVVAEPQAHPQAFELGPGEKRFTVRLKRVREFAHKIDASDIRLGNCSMFAIGRQYFDRFPLTESSRIQVSANRCPIKQKDDDFFMGGGWGRIFHAIASGAEFLQSTAFYVMLRILFRSSVYLSMA